MGLGEKKQCIGEQSEKMGTRNYRPGARNGEKKQDKKWNGEKKCQERRNQVLLSTRAARPWHLLPIGLLGHQLVTYARWN